VIAQDRPDVTRYLLNQLSADERKRMEALLFEDEELLPAIQDAEDHLIDRYLGDELSAEDRAAFERHFAASPLRQERIAFRRVLPGVLGSVPRDRPAPRRTAARWPVAPSWIGLAAVLVVGLLWLARYQEGGPVSPSPRPSPGVPSASPSDQAGPPSPSTTLVLRSGLLRSGGSLPRLIVPPDGTVRLDAELDAPIAASDYQAVLRTAEGRTVWKGSGRPLTESRRVAVVLPASVLRPGEYILGVGASGQPALEASEYAFQAVPRE
jgi:anti-sigma factor RsiW